MGRQIDLFRPEHMQQLSGRLAEVVRLRLEGLRNSDIAARLGISVQNVSFCISTARKKLGYSAWTHTRVAPPPRETRSQLCARAANTRWEERRKSIDPITPQDIERLSPRIRQAFVLSLGGVSCEQIAARMGLRDKHVATLYLSQARARILLARRRLSGTAVQPPPPLPPPAPKAVVAPARVRDVEPLPEEDPPDSPSVLRLRARAAHAKITGRSLTIPGSHLSREEKRVAALTVYPGDVQRPATRGECQDGPRPCPFVSCAHHLYLDVNETGSIKLNFPHLDPWEMTETCSLDVADRGGITLEEVGQILNLTRERIRQVAVRGLTKIRQDKDDSLAMIEHPPGNGFE